ncbi:MAG: bifunctional riboflavin kinase/FAD synthetase [bacterium]|nr:bifunctional riboflavin kinase/FAD synthetase [bacterium]
MKNTCITVGTFDGVHIGHREIVTTTLKISAAFKFEPLVLVLNYPPKFNLQNSERFLITTDEEKMSLLRELTNGKVEVLDFTKEIESLEPEEFLSFLRARYYAKHLVVGFNHTFGKGRKGDVPYLSKIAEKFDLCITVVPPVKIENDVVSSSFIRSLLYSGNVKLAAKCLGRFYSVSGIVVKGAGIAKELGFRTINLEIPDKKIVPKKGVYAVIVSLRGKNFPGACYIGESPTLGLSRFSIEVHLINFQGEVYGELATVQFVDFLREDIKFPSVEELKNQISKDVVASNKLISQFL